MTTGRHVGKELLTYVLCGQLDTIQAGPTTGKAQLRAQAGLLLLGLKQCGRLDVCVAIFCGEEEADIKQMARSGGRGLE